MNNYVGRMVLLLLACVCLVYSATKPNINDSVLVAYRLSSSQEQEVNQLGVFSAVWDTWSLNNIHDSATLDYVTLLPASSIWCGTFNGPTDASMTWMAVYGIHGMYIGFDIVDNVWQPSPDPSDMIRISFDTLNANTISQCDSCRPIELLSFTKTSVTVSFPSMTETANAKVYFSFFDSTSIAYLSYPFDSIPIRFPGMHIQGRLISDHLRRIVITIPWQWVGHRGTGTAPLEGQKFACTGGYDDADSITDLVSGHYQRSLRWEKHPESTQSYEYCYYQSPPQDAKWCDMDLGPAFSDVVRIMSRTEIFSNVVYDLI